MSPQHPPSPPPMLQRPVSREPVSLHEAGGLRFATDRLPWQRSLRWEKPKRDRRLLLLGGFIAFGITLLEVVGFGIGMRAHHIRPRPAQMIHVNLIEPLSELPPPPPEPEPPIVARPSRIAIAPPEVKKLPPPPSRPGEDSNEMRARIGEGGAVATPQLFNPDGSIRMGDGNGTNAPTLPKAPKNAIEAGKARWAQIETRGNPLDCKKTRFAGAFAPDESLGDTVSSKYLKWVGLSDAEAIARRRQERSESGGCEPAK